jgi:hypothetical protein
MRPISVGVGTILPLRAGEGLADGDGLDSDTRDFLRLIDTVNSFAAEPLYTQRELLSQVFAAIWLWPDGAIWIQWKDEPEDDVAEQTGGRSLRSAKRWETVDWD